ncbi:hypothetical protein D2T31_04470 [Sinirhodobacter populi]|uniref:Uncharacterized protein n=1 Tax=Paenirhodobacter populi TaxID=2306993 RepID=A0A443KFX2_9RHOB|nr:DUF6478 family protein [Sinirhodobacter populi]RWR31662.1 hypothetical protein D2T31_04470 [Sinirhodobacter populi]
MAKDGSFLARLLHRPQRQAPVAPDAADRPWGCDWAWRPETWGTPVTSPAPFRVEGRTDIGDGVALFHDCARPHVTVAQLDNGGAFGAALRGLSLEVEGFDGSFLSLVTDLPGAALEGLRHDHLFRVTARVELRRPMPVYFRLNLMHGGHTEQLLRQMDIGDGTHVVDFDLVLTRMDEGRLERGWVDVIFPDPAMNRVVLRDLTFLRHPRAEI